MIPYYTLHLFLLTIVSIVGFIYIIRCGYDFPFAFFTFVLDIFLFMAPMLNLFLCYYKLRDPSFEPDSLSTIYISITPFILTIPCLLLMRHKKIAFLKTRGIFKNIWNYILTAIYTLLLLISSINDKDFTMDFATALTTIPIMFLMISLVTSYISFWFILLNCHKYEKELIEGYSAIRRPFINPYRRESKVFCINNIDLSSIDRTSENYKIVIPKRKYPVYSKKGAYVVFSEDVY